MVSADLTGRVNSEEPKLKKVGYALMFLGMGVVTTSFVIAIALGYPRQICLRTQRRFEMRPHRVTRRQAEFCLNRGP
ncbi:MAG: hypothetical protein IIA09_19045 [Proteobacteria bacterium]|nr:hypothetical protein [Pseudomonadota bacterium]